MCTNSISALELSSGRVISHKRVGKIVADNENKVLVKSDGG